MSNNALFKILFEIQIIHDYFLTSTDGQSFYDKNKEERKNLIDRILLNQSYDVRNILTIIPTESTKAHLREYKLIMSRTPLGFIIGTEVSVENQSGETRYKPWLKFKKNLKLVFTFQSRISSFTSITNSTLRPSLPANYYFSNKGKEPLDESGVPNYTSLVISNKAMTHQNGMVHEMGAIVDFGGTLREAIQQTDGDDITHWEDIDDKRFATKADRMLLPHNFSYTLKKEAGATNVKFVLEDENGAIKTINKTSTLPLENVSVNFNIVDEAAEKPVYIPSGLYTLKIKESTKPEITYPIYLSDTTYGKNQLGAIEIRFDELDSPFSILDADGFLKTRINTSGDKVQHHVFEIRFKNRRTYWRYNQEENFEDSDITNELEPFIELQNFKLVSKKPKGLTEVLVPFTNGTPVVFPNPKKPNIRMEKEKIYSEIFISKSNRILNS